MNIIIMAGGRGTRFWPLSRHQKPKQFSAIIEKRSMLEVTFDRFNKDYPVDNIYVSTVPEFRDEIAELLPQLPAQNIIAEPEKRDTAAAMGFVAANLYLKEPDEPIAFIPSDHYIGDEAVFHKFMKVAEDLIKSEGKMLDIAINPNFPSTVLGYTKIGKEYKSENGVSVYEFEEHVEKPSYELAQKYINEGSYLWHASYYMWTPRKFLESFQKYAPDISKHLESIVKALNDADENKVQEEYGKMRKISFDYAVTENMDPDNVLIIKGDFGWSDIGAWDTLHDQLCKQADKNGNVIRGDWVGEDTTQSLIYGKDDKMIATIGMDDIVVVDTEDALLICPKGRAQDVKKIVEKLEKDKKHYL